MCVSHLHPLGNIHVPNLNSPVVTQEAVRRLEVTVADLLRVEVRERLQALNQVRPNHLLVDVLAAFFVTLDFFGEVTVGTVLHYNAELGVVAVEERLEESDDVRVSNAR